MCWKYFQPIKVPATSTNCHCYQRKRVGLLVKFRYTVIYSIWFVCGFPVVSGKLFRLIDARELLIAWYFYPRRWWILQKVAEIAEFSAIWGEIRTAHVGYTWVYPFRSVYPENPWIDESSMILKNNLRMLFGNQPKRSSFSATASLVNIALVQCDWQKVKVHSKRRIGEILGFVRRIGRIRQVLFGLYTSWMSLCDQCRHCTQHSIPLGDRVAAWLTG